MCSVALLRSLSGEGMPLAGSPGFRAWCFPAWSGSQTARGPFVSRDVGASGVAFRLSPQRRYPGVVRQFRGAIRGPPVPLSTLHPDLTAAGARLEAGVCRHLFAVRIPDPRDRRSRSKGIDHSGDRRPRFRGRGSPVPTDAICPRERGSCRLSGSSPSPPGTLPEDPRAVRAWVSLIPEAGLGLSGGAANDGPRPA